MNDASVVDLLTRLDRVVTERDALRARVKKLKAALSWALPLVDRYASFCTDEFDRARAALTGKDQEPQWVKVSERLPTREDADGHGNVWGWRDDGNGVLPTPWGDLLIVTHWMPKPRQEPPKPPEGE